MRPKTNSTVSQSAHQAERMTYSDPEQRIARNEWIVTARANAYHRKGIALPTIFLTLHSAARAIITQAAKTLDTKAFFMGAWH